jgi:hypothetical protein
LMNFSGMRSSSSSPSVVKRGQLREYAQQAPHAWQGFPLSDIAGRFSIAMA